MARLAPLEPSALSPQQRPIYDSIASQHTGNVRGPWAIMLRVPEVADHVHALYERLSTHTKLGRRLFELAVIVAAREWTSQFAWATHEKYALEYGIPKVAVDAIRENRTPDFERDDEQIVYGVVTELSRTKALSAATYARAQAEFGDELLVELISVAGTYTLIAMTLNAFDVPIPAGAQPLK